MSRIKEVLTVCNDRGLHERKGENQNGCWHNMAKVYYPIANTTLEQSNTAMQCRPHPHQKRMRPRPRSRLTLLTLPLNMER